MVRITYSTHSLGRKVGADDEVLKWTQGNTLFHVDSSFNPRRAGFSLLRAHELPPPGTGGGTEFADSRTAFAELPEDLKKELLEKDYVAAHSLWHSRKKASPLSSHLKDVEVEDYSFGRHKLVQMHEASGRLNLYIASHVHHLEYPEKDENGLWVRVPEVEGKALVEGLLQWCAQERFVVKVDWRENGDLIVWDK
jgi:alpha-ketoglutarate-dependent 2,4-dichlorophenoxyacetate dioxygenase